ncbi:MAG: hypothetical protein P9L92_06070 [Candidatus Electryonea clarkiae]|nr:hypothetical protein [Candidatus Electryonea clarkiae]MDP8285526.1 hypothetical protein [Candidatus Electryonea clarkiae]
MLRIKKVKNYMVPKYPQGVYLKKPPGLAGRLMSATVLTSAGIVALQGCKYDQTGGVPAVQKSMTETDARDIVEKVFAENDIQMTQDILLYFSHGNIDSAQLNLDGFNDSLKIGYEYAYDGWVINSDEEYYDPEEEIPDSLAFEIEQALGNEGPYIKLVRHVTEDGESHLSSLIQDFIDQLREQGII